MQDTFVPLKNSYHSTYRLGVSVDPPLWNPRYRNAQTNIRNEATRRYSVDEVVPGNEETQPQDGTNTVYVRTPQVFSMGLDPMVSSAAVIHELAFGRMTPPASPARNETGYVMQGAYLPAQLDLIA